MMFPQFSLVYVSVTDLRGESFRGNYTKREQSDQAYGGGVEASQSVKKVLVSKAARAFAKRPDNSSTLTIS